jgi:carbamoyl-phosphate synthase large subunit
VRELPEKSKAEWRKKILDRLNTPRPENVFLLRHALQLGVTLDELFESTKIDRWFLYNMKQIVDFEDELYSVRA